MVFENVNDLPTTQDASISGKEDQDVVLTLDQFDFSDVDQGDTLTEVTLSTPSSGKFLFLAYWLE